MKENYQIPISATLARRLAEAADGFRNVAQVYFIAKYEDPYTIKDFLDLTSAEIYFNENNYSQDEYGIFGPYKTFDDVYDLQLRGVEDIEKIDLKIHFKTGGDCEEVTLYGCIDSIFFNLSSFDKFVFPYYCHLFGANYAKEMRDVLIAQYEQHANGFDGSGKIKGPIMSVALAGAASGKLPPPKDHVNITYL
jgi:hypothetical protein